MAEIKFTARKVSIECHYMEYKSIAQDNDYKLLCARSKRAARAVDESRITDKQVSNFWQLPILFGWNVHNAAKKNALFCEALANVCTRFW